MPVSLAQDYALPVEPNYVPFAGYNVPYDIPQPVPPIVVPPNCCARLVTRREGRKEAILVSCDKPVVIGRNPSLWVMSHTGTPIISCQDFSTNGIILNGVKVHRESLILVDGDELQIPRSQTFTCHIPSSRRRAKADIFEPTPPPQYEDFRTMGKYRISSHALGSGSYGRVYLAMDMERRRQVACKTIRISSNGSATMPNDVMKEVNILKSLRHPNINCVWDIEQSDTFTYLFLELSTGGDLDMYIRRRRYLPEDEAKYLSYQLMLGLDYLHGLHIAHRDLKPENILLHEAGSFPRIIIADFGLARPRAFEETFRVAGTISYLPPEAITALNCKHIGYVGQPSDCWALGVCIYIMLEYVPSPRTYYLLPSDFVLRKWDPPVRL
ncbi:kinase-like protein [Exidia glandulosa HHB12029]|uniref:Kinase-like protein n=1 Tax=Exidia glandulosa HHB12029 TaxID=1314781 RepID=A0A165H214_EXIGL|nr:kinase-like protein [Exidia glandulosa HHB12029]